nr:redox-sensing transcriptional repressor Rex [Clostridia bacterium]
AGREYCSATILAEMVRENPAVVKKDLQSVISQPGKPKLGYEIKSAIRDIEENLGYYTIKNAILIGAGKLGQALLGYVGFDKYGFNILAGFDTNPELVGKTITDKNIYDISKMQEYIKENNILIAIVTVPTKYAQEVTTKAIEAGVRAIWNFAPTHLELPENIVVRNEDMAASLAILSKELKNKI